MYKVTYAFDNSIVYFEGSLEACGQFIGQHILVDLPCLSLILAESIDDSDDSLP